MQLALVHSFLFCCCCVSALQCLAFSVDCILFSQMNVAVMRTKFLKTKKVFCWMNGIMSLVNGIPHRLIETETNYYGPTFHGLLSNPKVICAFYANHAKCNAGWFCCWCSGAVGDGSCHSWRRWWWCQSTGLFLTITVFVAFNRARLYVWMKIFCITSTGRKRDMGKNCIDREKKNSAKQKKI